MRRILVVDDDPLQIELRQLVLESAGYEVRTAISAHGALRTIGSSRPDLLMMDLKFPNAEGTPDAEQGLELIRGVHREAPGLPVIVLSGWPEDLEGRPEEAMVSRVLVKTCRPQALLAAVRELLPVLFCCAVLAGVLSAEPRRFRVQREAEVVATLELSSPGADWSKPGREAALADLSVDGGKPQHVMLYAGERRHAYAVLLGTLQPGEHTLAIERNPRYSAAAAGLEVHGVTFREIIRGEPEWAVLANAPLLYARADTIGQFTDVPLIAYCERLREYGSEILQYTVIFSNEDGGTSTRALMARWGRTTDIEYIYRGAVNGAGLVEKAIIQAKDHKDIPFDGVYEGTHPVLIPFTRNNMVSASGASPIRYQLAPVTVDLSGHSREEVMDSLPYSYRVTAQEMEREGKLRPFGAVQGENISDPRNYLSVEVKMRNQTAGLGVVVKLKHEAEWRTSHLGRADYAMDRNGWARSTVELPPGTRAQDIAEIGFECLVPPARPPLLSGACRVEGVSKAFLLGEDYRPGVSFFEVKEEFTLPSGQLRMFPLVFPHVAAR